MNVKIDTLGRDMTFRLAAELTRRGIPPEEMDRAAARLVAAAVSACWVVQRPAGADPHDPELYLQLDAMLERIVPEAHGLLRAAALRAAEGPAQ